MTLSETQRWHVREKWKAGEDPGDLAREYGVAPSVIDHEIRTYKQQIEMRQAAVPRGAPVDPQETPLKGIECGACGHVNPYGSGTPSLVESMVLARCPKCNRTTPHRKIAEGRRDPQPVTTLRDHGVARRSDPETSHEAAALVSGLRASQEEVLGVLRRRGPMTDEEVLRVLLDRRERPWTPSGARTRRSELVAGGYVRDSGRRKRLETGRRSILWEAVGQ